MRIERLKGNTYCDNFYDNLGENDLCCSAMNERTCRIVLVYRADFHGGCVVCEEIDISQ